MCVFVCVCVCTFFLEQRVWNWHQKHQGVDKTEGATIIYNGNWNIVAHGENKVGKSGMSTALKFLLAHHLTELNEIDYHATNLHLLISLKLHQ
jgi:hypothetical protein